MGSRTWKMVEVLEFFNEDRVNSFNGKTYPVAKMRLSCGHIATDPKESYANEMSFKFQRLRNAFDLEDGKLPKSRCYKCGQLAKTANAKGE